MEFSLSEKVKILRVKHQIQDFVNAMEQMDWYQRTIKNSDLILTGGITVSLLHDENP